MKMRLVNLVRLSVRTTAILAVVYLLPELSGFLPNPVKEHWNHWVPAAVIAGFGLARWITNHRESIGIRGQRLVRVLDATDSISGKFLDRGLAFAFGAIVIGWLATWLPHYLSWPWQRDVDTFAVMAQAWSLGELPYRDIRAYNFPGHTYLHWILGHLFGWGRTSVFYAVDALALLALGGVILVWSKRRFGRYLPGVSAYLIVLGYYLNLHFEVVAERDWHAALGVTVGLLVLQGWQGRNARWFSAMLTAVAFTIRPHVVLFLPALASAVWETGHAPDLDCPASSGRKLRYPGRRLSRLLEWSLVFGFLAALGFVPLILAGVMGDFVRGLSVAGYGGPYSKATPGQSLAMLAEQFIERGTFALLIALMLMAWRSKSRDMRALSRTWLLALAGAFLYRPLHPVAHFYLRVPLALVSAVSWALPIAWLIRRDREMLRLGITPFVSLFTIIFVVYETVPSFPTYCSVGKSLEAIRALARGSWPDNPGGAWIWYRPYRQPNYTWDAYCRTLRYLGTETSPETIVANVLKHPPFPSINGPTGRRSPFRVESGVAWMWLVDEDLDTEFARQLEQAGRDSVVVWSPSEIGTQSRLELRRLTRTILRLYEPEARFDRIEVWRRRAGDAAESMPPPTSPRIGPEARLRPP